MYHVLYVVVRYSRLGVHRGLIGLRKSIFCRQVMKLAGMAPISHTYMICIYIYIYINYCLQLLIIASVTIQLKKTGKEGTNL